MAQAKNGADDPAGHNAGNDNGGLVPRTVPLRKGLTSPALPQPTPGFIRTPP